MAGYEAFRHVTIGQYIATDTPVHRLDARAKLVSFMLLVVAVALCTDYVANLLLFACLWAMLRPARLSMRYALRSIGPAIPIIIVLALFQLFFYRGAAMGETAIVSLGWLRLYPGAVRLVLVSFMRLADLMALTALLTATTTTGELTHALEYLLSPLSRIGVPGHELAMVGSVALRFLPILGEELESIVLAHTARGVGGNGSRWRMVENGRRVAAVIVPLFVDAFRRAEDMSLAMQARGYRGGAGRTRLSSFTWNALATWAMALVLLVIALSVAAQYSPLP